MVLRAIEQKIEALFEGVFGRAFRTNVQPVELARKIAKEMDDHRTVSVSRVYVPNEYTVFLSTADREQFEGYEDSLLAELEEYVARAREARELCAADAAEGAARDGRRSRARRVRHRDADGAAEARQSGGRRAGGGGRVRRDDDLQAEGLAGDRGRVSPRSSASSARSRCSRWDGQTKRVDKRRILLGRSRECDIQVEDPNVSRRHAELRQEGASYWIVDLESTNGIEVNGRRVKRAKLDSGDSFTVGSTEITFTTERE